MKKSLYVFLLLTLLAVSFLAGNRFNQRTTHQNTHGTADRQILHYIDPMDPAHVSKEPGIAPCGMPMEPVYAEEDASSGPGPVGAALSAIPGAVGINLQKQQIIGVQIGEAARASQTSTIRALGRIVPDENRVYTLIAATDGWLEEIDEGTTGSIVAENQLMARIKVYNYDFFTWQQRYLTELGYTGRIGGATSPISATDQSRRRASSGAGYRAGLPIPESETRLIKREAVIAQMSGENEHSLMGGSPSSITTPETSATADYDGGSRENNRLYASKGRQELLNAGVDESRLNAFAEDGIYITHIDVRSPVNGYVLARKVASRQKIDSGTECFRIADLGRVWVEADIFDSEAKYVHPGMPARISMPRQAEHFTATVDEVLPRFDAASRSLKVRLVVDNPGYVFRPDMFVDVEFFIPLPESIAVPSSAVIDSGLRQTVYAVVEEGIFEPREVVTGWRTNNLVEIVEGLQDGEKIVVSGNFLIDSESRMKLAAKRVIKETPQQPVNSPVPVAPSVPEPRPVQPAEKRAVKQSRPVTDGLTVEAAAKALPDRLGYLAAGAGERTPTETPAHREHQHD